MHAVILENIDCYLPVVIFSISSAGFPLIFLHENLTNVAQGSEETHTRISEFRSWPPEIWPSSRIRFRHELGHAFQTVVIVAPGIGEYKDAHLRIHSRASELAIGRGTDPQYFDQNGEYYHC